MARRHYKTIISISADHPPWRPATPGERRDPVFGFYRIPAVPAAQMSQGDSFSTKVKKTGSWLSSRGYPIKRTERQCARLDQSCSLWQYHRAEESGAGEGVLEAGRVNYLLYFKTDSIAQSDGISKSMIVYN